MRKLRAGWRPYAVVAALLAATWGGLEIRAAVAPDDRSDAEAGRLRSERAFLALEACFIGEPLAPGETLDERLLAIHSARTFGPAVEAAPGESAWPRRCVAHAKSLADAFGEEAIPDTHRQGIASRIAAVLDGGVAPVSSTLVPLDALASRFRETVRSLAPGDVPRAPKPLRPLLGRDAGQWPNGSTWSMGELADDELRLSVDGLGLGCRVRTDRAEATCLAVPDGARRGRHAPQILSTPADGPLLVGFGHEGGSSVVDLDDGRILFEDEAYLGAAARTPGGALVVFMSDESKTFLSTLSPPVGTSPARAERKPFDAAHATFIGGEVLITNGRGDSTEVRALTGNGSLGEPVRLARGAGWGRDDVRACHAGSDLIVAAYRRVGRIASTLVLVRHDGRWAHHEVARSGVSLACAKDEALLLASGSDGEIERHRCTFEGCTGSRFPAPRFSWEGANHPVPPDEAGKRVAAACGERVVLAGVTKTAIELVVAAPAELAAAPRRLFHRSTLIHELSLFSSSSGVIAIVHGMDGKTMARIGCDGAVEPVVPRYGTSAR